MNLVFDFDGTICDSFSKAVEIANSYLAKSSRIPITKDELKNKGIKRLIGDRKLTLWQKLMLVRTARHEAAKYIDGFETFRGVPEVLQKLHNKNHLAILTTNSKKNVEKFLEKHKLNKFFDSVYISLEKIKS